jgi:hypothetical protein
MLTGRSYGAANFGGINEQKETISDNEGTAGLHQKSQSKTGGNNSLISRSMNLGGGI